MEQIRKSPELLSLHNHKTLGDYVVVVPAVIDEPGITTRAAQFEDRPEVGLVVSIGDNVDDIPVGSTIFFGKYSTVQITHDDIIYNIMRREDVYCVA